MKKKNDNSDLPSFSHAAENYRDEYRALKKLMPSEAKKIVDAVANEFADEFAGEKFTRGQRLADLSAVGGVFATTGAIILGLAGIVAAPVAVPVALGSIVVASIGAANVKGGRKPEDVLADNIDQALENGDLLKRYIDGMTRYRKPLPECFGIFNDQAMSGRYLPASSASQRLALPPMSALLTGSFNDRAGMNDPANDVKPSVGPDSKKSTPPKP